MTNIDARDLVKILPEERGAEGNNSLTPALYIGFQKKRFKQVLPLLCYSLCIKHCIYAERKEGGEQYRSFSQQDRQEHSVWGEKENAFQWKENAEFKQGVWSEMAILPTVSS